MAEITKVNYQTKIVCLAASRKPGGQCIAGKEVVAGGYGRWVRPVSVRPSAEIQISESHYENGTEPQLLDIITIPMLAPVPRLHQTENHMIDDRFYWQKKGALEWDDLDDLQDAPATLWTNTDPDSYHGSNDRVSETAVGNLTTSLALIKPENAFIQVLTPGAAFNDPKRAVRAGFDYNHVHYNFRVTDPVVEKTFYARDNGTYQIEQEAYFCVSLAETAYQGHCYKLVASILTDEPL